MRLVGKNKLEKLKRKNKGNSKLIRAIEQLVEDFESGNWKNAEELKIHRLDADCVHRDGFYFFDIHIHRTLVLIEFDDNGEATVAWIGTHQEYEKVFKNNKNTIRRWLRTNDYIE